MKIKILLLAIFVFCKTTFAQTPKDSMLLVKAIAVMKESNFEAANKYLKKVSTSGKNSVNFLACRAAFHENSKSNLLAKNDYDSLYSKTADIRFKLKSENMLLLEKRKILEDSIRNNCKICKSNGYYNEDIICNLCTNGIDRQSSCSSCFGSGERSCNNCNGSGKITKYTTITTAGVTKTTSIQESCYACNSRGSFNCNTCFGVGNVTKKCNTCFGKGTKPKKVICPLHK